MATFHAQECPLCGAAAEYCWVDARNRKYFKCPSCTYFQISIRAEELLSERFNERRDAYALQAPRAPVDHMLVIRMPDQDHRERSSDPLQATFVPKSELPLRCE